MSANFTTAAGTPLPQLAATELDGESFFRIAHHDRMRPFFLSIVSSADLWMFISSTGALTAGRRNPDLAIFPYYTDDKIHDSVEVTGPKTLLRVEQRGKTRLWEPFSDFRSGDYRVERSLAKSITGDKLSFEEINRDLELAFRYCWMMSERFGIVRTVWLTNAGRGPLKIELLDGLQNILPCGAGSQFQLEKSTLLDAYKKNELIPETGLGLFTLSSNPIDRPEPAESLRATTVWSVGLHGGIKLLSSRQIPRFRAGERVVQETDVRGERGAYFVQKDFRLRPGHTIKWSLVADTNQSSAAVATLNHRLRKPSSIRAHSRNSRAVPRLQREVEQDVARGTRELRAIVTAADGLQLSADALGNARHFGNVLFNVMRGGTFIAGYEIDTADLRAFIQNANRQTAERHGGFFKGLGTRTTHAHLLNAAERTGDADLERLCREYLPLAFSRRHGDPSRPWNRFNIPSRKPDGSRVLSYEGNWRDIFQNWDALAVSFSGYLGSMICRFVNASTPDGYNPYRLTRDGIEWEVPDPADPWAHMGYWCDHQVIYLLKLLELLDAHEPATLRALLGREIFCYANVPYRIKPYAQLLEHPKDTVVFDQQLESAIRERVQKVGADGKLLLDGNGRVRHVNLAEKLLVSLLAKLSNFIPEAGVWLNTQRPEWNDANNALVGNGVSMVTLCYLRRHLAFCAALFRSAPKASFALSEEVVRLLRVITKIFADNGNLLDSPISDSDRKRLIDLLGRAGSRYRETIYSRGFSGEKAEVPARRLVGFFELALTWIDRSLAANRRTDGLYHAYNLASFSRATVGIRPLYEMLEGQVAALSSGCLSAEGSLRVLRALRLSAMYRRDQHSYLLYPDRRLARFIEKNNIPREDIADSALLRKLLADRNRSLIEPDSAGGAHFSSAITNAQDVSRILDQLGEGDYARLVRRDRRRVLELFERLFDHQSFTGRSGTFFGYEGLGSIYWHMVSKLLLATQETIFRAVDSEAPQSLLRQLADCYHDIRAGLGDRKSPAAYGAFPMDPYSHTPAHAGARQPGLTGQVKEDILCRWGELGVRVRNGEVHFRPLLLREEEFLTAPAPFRYVDLRGITRRLRLPPGSLAFTYCNVPVIYRLAATDSLGIEGSSGLRRSAGELRLDSETSRSVFSRSGYVTRIVVSLSPKNLSGERAPDLRSDLFQYW